MAHSTATSTPVNTINSPPSMASPPNFCTEELQRALKEQSFGVQAYRMDTSSSMSLQASASVTLLEGSTINIMLSQVGYAVDPQTCPGVPQNAIFETIENLLQVVSPMYERKQLDTLMQRLEKLS